MLLYGQLLVVRGSFETVDEVEARDFGCVNRLWAPGPHPAVKPHSLDAVSKAPPSRRPMSGRIHTTFT